MPARPFVDRAVLSAAHLPAYEFAQEVVRLLVEPEAQDGQRRRIVAVYLDPSNFKDIGDGTATTLSPYPSTC
jgi:hypothetical protein